MKIDLHVHTLYSDGVFSPEKIVDTAIDVGLQAISLTDHDNILSYKVAQKYIKRKNLSDKIEVINGVEINTLHKNYEVHILGYFMEHFSLIFVLKIKRTSKYPSSLSFLCYSN